MKKEKLFCTSEQFEEIQEEHRKILETIENALLKLKSECTHIFEQHKYKVQQLTEKLIQLENIGADKLTIFECRADLLRAKREMLCWKKVNKKTQVTSKCVLTLDSAAKIYLNSLRRLILPSNKSPCFKYNWIRKISKCKM